MRIETSRFGPIELDDDKLIHFPWGIPGFEKLKQYVLLEHQRGPFQWLQAVDDPDVAFVVCPPETLGLTYLVPREKLTPLAPQSDDDLLVLIMVTIDRKEKSLRPHLRGPLLFDTRKRSGYQWTLDSGDIDKYIHKLKNVV